MLKKLRNLLRKKYKESPIGGWFGLSYCAYLVLQRSLLEGMPIKWQKKFVELLNEMGDTYEWESMATKYEVHLRGKHGWYEKDPLANYRHTPELPYRKR